jgi:hypothetical protein
MHLIHRKEVMPPSEYRRSRAANLLWIMALSSLLFCGFLGWGCYHFLFGILGSSPLFLWTLTLLIPAIALSLAKLIGSSEKPHLARNLLLFTMLSLASMLSVLQVGLLQSEVPRVFAQAIHEAGDRFARLHGLGDQLLRDSAVEQRIADIRRAATALNTEILDDSNCGEGIRVEELAANLRKLLPHFQTLPGKINCYAESERALLEQRTATYDGQVEELITRSDWYIGSKYEEKQRLRGELQSALQQAQAQLYELESVIKDGPIRIGASLHKLEEVNDRYHALANDLRRLTPAAAVPEELDLKSIRKLDQWGALNILMSWLDRPRAYVYLSLALLLDGTMIELFRRGRALSTDRREASAPRAMIRGISMRGLPR